MPSSVIRSFDYDSTTRRLTVRFVGGRVYAYDDVPPEIAVGLGAAQSRGSYFNLVIRDRFMATRLRQD